MIAMLAGFTAFFAFLRYLQNRGHLFHAGYTGDGLKSDAVRRLVKKNQQEVFNV